MCRCPRAGCTCHRADQPLHGKCECTLPPTHLTGSCAPQTTYKGKSSFQTYSDYLRWESFLQQQLQTFPEGSALRRGFQTCEHWKQIFMEIIGKRQPSPSPPNCPGLKRRRMVAGYLGQGGQGVACLNCALVIFSSLAKSPRELEWPSGQEPQSEAGVWVSCSGAPSRILFS